MQALRTKTFIVYNLHARTPKHICRRIKKVCDRGFCLLEPTNFDGNFDVLMAQEETPLYRSEQCPYIDDDGELHIATTEYHRMPIDNMDIYQSQEAFIASVCPELLDLE